MNQYHGSLLSYAISSVNKCKFQNIVQSCRVGVTIVKPLLKTRKYSPARAKLARVLKPISVIYFKLKYLSCIYKLFVSFEIFHRVNLQSCCLRCHRRCGPNFPESLFYVCAHFISLSGVEI